MKNSKLQTVDSLPLYTPSRRLRYEGQIKPLDLLRLLLLEMWYGGEIFENEDFSQLFLYSLLYFETCSLRKHCKDDSNEFMSYRK